MRKINAKDTCKSRARHAPGTLLLLKSSFKIFSQQPRSNKSFLSPGPSCLSGPDLLAHEGHVGDGKGDQHQRRESGQVRPYQQHALPHGQGAGQGAGELRHSDGVYRADRGVKERGRCLPEEIIGGEAVQVQLAGVIFHLVDHGLQIVSAHRIESVRYDTGQKVYKNGAEQPQGDTGESRCCGMAAEGGAQDGCRQPEADIDHAKTQIDEKPGGLCPGGNQAGG